MILVSAKLLCVAKEGAGCGQSHLRRLGRDEKGVLALVGSLTWLVWVGCWFRWLLCIGFVGWFGLVGW